MWIFFPDWRDLSTKISWIGKTFSQKFFAQNVSVDKKNFQLFILLSLGKFWRLWVWKFFFLPSKQISPKIFFFSSFQKKKNSIFFSSISLTLFGLLPKIDSTTKIISLSGSSKGRGGPANASRAITVEDIPGQALKDEIYKHFSAVGPIEKFQMTSRTSALIIYRELKGAVGAKRRYHKSEKWIFFFFWKKFFFWEN